jgi:uncharacterized membrane protein YczE
MGFSIDLLRFSLFGNDPFSCMQLGFSNFFEVSYGTCVIIFNLFAIVPIFLIDRSFIQFGTLVNMFLTGPVVDGWYALMLWVYPDFALLTFSGRVTCLLVGVVICCYGVSMYMMSNVGMGPYDAIGWIIEKVSKKKIPFKYARIATDATATFIGFIFSSIVGLGTLIMAMGTGPLVTFFNGINHPLIYKR